MKERTLFWRRLVMTNAKKWICGFVFGSILLLLSYFLYDHFRYSTEKVDLFERNHISIVMDGKILPYTVKKSGNTTLLPVSFLKEQFDPQLYVDESTNSVILTTDDNVIVLKDSQIQGLVNPVNLSLPVPLQQDKQEYWIPTDPLTHIYPFQVDSEQKQVVVVTKTNTVNKYATVEKDKQQGSHLRMDPNRKSSITADVSLHEKVFAVNQQNNWTFVQKENGFFGWIETDMLSGVIKPETAKTSTSPSILTPTKSAAANINLTWEAVYCCNPDPATLQPLPGVNVVSPTWFSLGDANGNLTNKTSLPYITWAKANGKQVWALFSNEFEPVKTHAFLTNYQARMLAIQQLVAWTKLYNLEGINIDFENVYLEDKPHLVQFVRELTPFLHKEGKIVSIDVTHPGGSDMWSLFLDRQTLAKSVDYMMVMSYDEHWAGGPEAGSVASLPWVEKGIQEMLKEVPAEKLILGVPFYTRLWNIKDGNVTSQTMSMDAARAWVAEHQLTPTVDEETKQQYVEFLNPDGSMSRMWLENEVSVKQRIDLIHKYKLAGIGSWARAFSSNEIWNTVNQNLHLEGSQ